jgi:hypothetical protein
MINHITCTRNKIFYSFIFTLFLLSSCSGQNKKVEEPELVSFRKFLVQKNIDKNLGVQNEYETLNEEHFYSNHYFNFSTKLPKNYTLDRGNEEYTIIRGLDTLTSSTVHISVTPISKTGTGYLKFQSSPMKYIDEVFGVNFKEIILNTFKTKTTIEVLNFDVSESKVRTTNYVIYTVQYEETYDSIQIPFVNVQYVTYLWGNLFTISYTSPEVLFDPKILSEVLVQTNYIEPQYE